MSAFKEVLADERSALEKLKIALEQVSASGRNKLESDFMEAYPLLEQHLAGKRRKKPVMERFNGAYGHQLSLIQFRKLLNSERQRRQMCGEPVACATCGKPLDEAADVVGTAGIEEEAR
ncbi:MAG: hypothetical protein DI584_07235 [Stenotrophomonas sp.]|nr:MAG: hypothetical protein DI584_07235 [Stenotrophomonas sp.]